MAYDEVIYALYFFLLFLRQAREADERHWPYGCYIFKASV